jgi:hypothetical protein
MRAPAVNAMGHGDRAHPAAGGWERPGGPAIGLVMAIRYCGLRAELLRFQYIHLTTAQIIQPLDLWRSNNSAGGVSCRCDSSV